MANSNWVEADKQCQQKGRYSQDAFYKYTLWFLATGEEYLCDGLWKLTRVYERLPDTPLTIELTFYHRWSDGRASHTWIVRSLSGWAAALSENHCPVPQSLSAILGELRQGGDGKAAVDFYTQSGDVF